MELFALTRRTLFASVILAITLLIIYYQGIYRLFYDYYKNQYVEVRLMNFSTQGCETSDSYPAFTPTIPATLTQTPDPLSTLEVTPTNSSAAADSGQEDEAPVCMWSLIMQIPKFVSYSAPGWIYFELKNEGSKSQIGELDINLSGEKISLLPSMYKDDVFVRALERKQIARDTTLYGRIFFGGNHIVDLEECNLAIKNAFYLNSEIVDTEAEGNLKCPENDIKKSLYRSLIENILLPPWANTLIPVISLFVCFMYDIPSRKKDVQTTESVFVTGGKVVKIYSCSLLTFFIVGLIFVHDLLQTLDNSVNFVSPETKASVVQIINILLFSFAFVILISTLPKIMVVWKDRVDVRKGLINNLDDIRRKLAKFRKS